MPTKISILFADQIIPVPSEAQRTDHCLLHGLHILRTLGATEAWLTNADHDDLGAGLQMFSQSSPFRVHITGSGIAMDLGRLPVQGDPLNGAVGPFPLGPGQLTPIRLSEMPEA